MAGMNVFYAYIGPTIRGLIQGGTIFAGSRADVAAAIARVKAADALAASLIIKSDRLSEARQKVKTPGNLYYENYHKILRRGKNK